MCLCVCMCSVDKQMSKILWGLLYKIPKIHKRAKLCYLIFTGSATEIRTRDWSGSCTIDITVRKGTSSSARFSQPACFSLLTVEKKPRSLCRSERRSWGLLFNNSEDFTQDALCANLIFTGQCQRTASSHRTHLPAHHSLRHINSACDLCPRWKVLRSSVPAYLKD